MEEKRKKIAGFKTHTLTGAITGVAFIIFLLLHNLTQNIYLLLILLLFAIVGSALPDIDSDSSKPLKIIFTMLGILSSISIFHLGLIRSKDIWFLIFAPITNFIFVRYPLSMIFKKFTSHRGIFHSIPALVVSFLTAFTLSDFFPFSEISKFFLATSIALGFLSHLILDEVYAGVSFLGDPFKSSKSLGSCFEIISNSKFSTTLAYSIIFVLGYYNFERLKDVYQILF